MKKGFTLIELIFVIIVMGILAKFGSNLLFTVYRSYTASEINNRLQSDAEATLKQIGNRLQYRIKDSIIARTAAGNFSSLTSAPANAVILEWIGYDIDGWHGTSRAGQAGEGTFNRPSWSGFIAVDDNAAFTAKTYLESPETDTGVANTIITAVSPGTTGINNAAIFFTGANNNVQTDYGWDGTAQDVQSTAAAHKINAGATVTQLADGTTGPASTFANTDIYENYKLAWTAYAIELSDSDSDGNPDQLILHYDYQPWEGEAYDDANTSSALLLDNVDTFKARATGDAVSVQLCVNDDNLLGEGEYSICKEITIF